MQKREFGRTGHMSSIAIFGGFAFFSASQEEADDAMQVLIEAGVNHIDVAPSYGQAEERLGPWMARERQRFFLGCKTMERERDGATAEMHRSLERLQTEAFDLYQIHAITKWEELDQVTSKGGALEALVAARDAGLTRYLGITGHGWDAPAMFLEALRRFDFDSVLFPVNFKMFADPTYRQNAEALLAECAQRQVGVMAIKAIAKGMYGERPQTHNTWYEPFTDPERIRQGVRFTLSQPVTGYCTAGDLQVLPKILEACEQFEPLSTDQQQALMAQADQFEPIFDR